jgi:hypothetical protein
MVMEVMVFGLALVAGACASHGIARGTAQYDRCVQNEFAVRRPG